MMSEDSEMTHMNLDDETAQFNFDIEELTENKSDADMEEDATIESVSNLGMSELFATLRMEIDDERSLQKERLQSIIASSDSSAVEINEAMNEMNHIDQRSTKEKILQETILTENEHYDDVLVRAEDDKVHVHIMTEQLTREEANKIMQTVRDELGQVVVDVHFQDES